MQATQTTTPAAASLIAQSNARHAAKLEATRRMRELRPGQCLAIDCCEQAVAGDASGALCPTHDGEYGEGEISTCDVCGLVDATTNVGEHFYVPVCRYCL